MPRKTLSRGSIACETQVGHMFKHTGGKTDLALFPDILTTVSENINLTHTGVQKAQLLHSQSALLSLSGYCESSKMVGSSWSLKCAPMCSYCGHACVKKWLTVITAGTPAGGNVGHIYSCVD
ncbi:hypothetical protein ATANTOWER_015323 [Ataeniobius toweri]|uniref:Uncharacterized protein n=1 Tax=Ataeniobius toweri TaxID=208326 RepID=A0ABU7B6Z1_9TELE|nr:hypothetical protein [Ataeniobius toweri]